MFGTSQGVSANIAWVLWDITPIDVMRLDNSDWCLTKDVRVHSLMSYHLSQGDIIQSKLMIQLVPSEFCY